MIIVKIEGPLVHQLSQYAFGRECARLLQTELKLDVADYRVGEPYQYSLDQFTVEEEIASANEITEAKQIGIVAENTQLWTFETFDRVHDGMYLEGRWADFRYAEGCMATLAECLQPRFTFDAEFGEVLAKIATSESVAIDLRNPQATRMHLPQSYFEDAIKEIRSRVPNAHLIILSDHPVPQFLSGSSFTPIITHSGVLEAKYLQLMRACRHYVVTNDSLSYWAARLGGNRDSVVIAPQQAFSVSDEVLLSRFGNVQQPVWPRSWWIVPLRIVQSHPKASTFLGGHNEGRPICVGVWNYYEEITRNGFLFKTPEVSVGANLLKPWCDLYEYGQAHGIHFVTLDQIGGLNDLDAVIFMDRPRSGHSLIDAIMQLPIKKYLMLYETEIIKADNWDIEYHKQFDRVFTWSDAHADGLRYIKINYAIDPNSPYDFEVLKSAFEQRKLATCISGAKKSQHPFELYSDRERTIYWFDASAPEDFDLYGKGWNREQFPSYRGLVQDKLATLSHYRFAICYENAKCIPGYISEKMLDCFRAGTVPVYGGAPNVARWVPPDCYIDIGQFQTYYQLYDHLRAMDAVTHSAYLDRIHRYLYSELSYPFSTECFINTVTEVVAWDVQSSRGETPLRLQEEIAQRGAPAKAKLVQDLTTLRFKLEIIQSTQTQEHTVVIPNADQLRRESFQNAGRKDLIVYLGYGDELPVYKRARALWEFYISHFPSIKAFFVRSSNELPRGEVFHNGYDLLIGTGEEGLNKNEGSGYRETGIWSANENSALIYKQMTVFDYLLRKHTHPFYLFHATVTSVVDFRGLLTIMDRLPATRCFAGSPGRMTGPPELAGLTIVSGANTLFSRDIIELLRNRYDPDHAYARLPNDVWQALVLQDIPRIPIPFISFVKPRYNVMHNNKIGEITKRLLNQGFYQFRVKTTSDDPTYGPREEIDPWIMLKIMDAILESHPPALATPQLIDKFTLTVNPANGKTLSGFNEDSYFTGMRNYPLNDIEAETIFPDLVD